MILDAESAKPNSETEECETPVIYESKELHGIAKQVNY